MIKTWFLLLCVVRAIFLFFPSNSRLVAGDNVPNESQSITKVVFSPNDLDDLPHLGQAVLRKGHTPVVQIGKLYIGEKSRGVLNVINRTGADIEIKSVATSCGCTAAFPARRTIEDGDENRFVCSVKPNRSGNFSVNISVNEENSRWGVTLEGNAVPPFEPVAPTLRYSAEEQNIELLMKLNRELADDAQLSVYLGSLEPKVRKLTNSVGSFTLPVSALPESGVVEITPASITDGKRHLFPPLRWRLLKKGHIELIATNVFVRDRGDSKRFRLLFRGDVAGLAGECKGSVCKQDFNAEVKTSGSTAIVLCETPSEFKPCGLSQLSIFEKLFSVTLLEQHKE